MSGDPAESRFRWVQRALRVDAIGSGGNFNGNSQIDARMALLGTNIDFAFTNLGFHRALVGCNGCLIVERSIHGHARLRLAGSLE